MSRYSSTLHRFATGNAAVPSVELVYTSHARWPLPSRPHEAKSNIGHAHDWPHSLAVSVLDSSFNPPTNAHLALARIPPASSPPLSLRAFDAKLLLYSIKNADKVLKPGDAAHEQRLEMMVLLAHELETIGEKTGDPGSQNVAVAVCQEPTFVGKSMALSLFLHGRLAAFPLGSLTAIQLSFLLGFDTLERLFAPRYYSSESAMKDALRNFLSPSGHNSRVICARRASGASYSQTESNVLDAATEFIDSGAVVLVDIGANEQTLSSSEVRENIRDASEDWQSKVPLSIQDYVKENKLYNDELP